MTTATFLLRFQVCAGHWDTRSPGPGCRSWSALRWRRSCGRSRGCRDLVKKHPMPAACQPTGHALRGDLVREGTDPGPVIRPVRALAWGHVHLGDSLLHVVQHRLGVVLLGKGLYLDFIHERLIQAFFLPGDFFRDDYPH
jgi:hypothetical protein